MIMEIIMTAEDAPLDRPMIKIDADEFEAAQHDPRVTALLAEARPYREQVVAEGRDHTDIAGIIPNLSQGVHEETVQRWKDEGKIHATTLPAGSLLRFTSEDKDRLVAEGKLYSPFPWSVAEAALKAAQVEKLEPPTVT
jgi:hypothetical protein